LKYQNIAFIGLVQKRLVFIEKGEELEVLPNKGGCSGREV
jgi:hypothetical protein